jgi:crotonobetainyl-CoA:carnitine CoA-transferase CaiB-like acyl-CoA transferase
MTRDVGRPARESPEFLDGLRVLELGDAVAGASATSQLRALGASVVSVVEADSPHRRGRPQDDGVSLLARCLDRGKELVHVDGADEVGEMVDSGFDVVVVDRVHGVRGALAPLASVEQHLEFVDAHPGVAWVTISAFGLTGPRAGDVATELTVAAASGMLASVRDERTGQPLKLGGQQSLLNTGQAGALAACHAVDLASSGSPVHLDLSAVEATLVMGPVLEVGGILLETGSIGGAKRYGAPASFYRCSDGLVRISAMEDHQWRGVVAAMGSPWWAERFASVEARIEEPEVIDEHVAAWASTVTKLEAETVLQANGVPATAVFSPVEILASPQLAHREALEELVLDDGRNAQVVGLPFHMTAPNDERLDRRTPRSLKGLRLLEASRVLAVPLCGALLGVLGAEVTKLEDLPRLDMYRRRGPYIEGQQGMERSAYFALMNHSKSSVAFDVDDDRPRLDALIAASDVIIENLGRKRATALGLGATVTPLRHPDLLAVSSSGFGQDGPHADYRAYAYNLQASAALGYLTRTRAGELAEIDIAWADLISAYALATIIAAWAVGPSGNEGTGVDFAMTDLIVSHFNEHLAAASLDAGADDADRANELCPYAPHGVYPTDDGWVAIAVDGDDEHARLATVLAADGLVGPSFATAAGRVADRDELDRQVGAATARRPSGDLAAELRSCGISAEVVLDAAGLVADEQLEARGLFATVGHAVWGQRRLVGLPWRPYGQDAMRLGAPPLLDAVAPAEQQP